MVNLYKMIMKKMQKLKNNTAEECWINHPRSSISYVFREGDHVFSCFYRGGMLSRVDTFDVSGVKYTTQCFSVLKEFTCHSAFFNDLSHTCVYDGLTDQLTHRICDSAVGNVQVILGELSDEDKFEHILKYGAIEWVNTASIDMIRGGIIPLAAPQRIIDRRNCKLNLKEEIKRLQEVISDAQHN